jgi:hypothetical protein
MNDKPATGRMPPLKWDTKPPTGEDPSEWRIKRARAKEVIEAIVLSHQLIGRNVHYWGGRTTPCWDNDQCPPCLAGRAKVWKAWLAATDEKLQARWILELTRPMAKKVDACFHKLRTLKGMGIAIKHANGMLTGPYWVGQFHHSVPQHALPDAPDVIARLCHVWQVHWVPVEAQQQLAGIHLAPTGTEGER